MQLSLRKFSEFEGEGEEERGYIRQSGGSRKARPIFLSTVLELLLWSGSQETRGCAWTTELGCSGDIPDLDIFSMQGCHIHKQVDLLGK